MTGSAALGKSSSWVWTRQQALEVMTGGQLRSELARGHWQSVWGGVYADGGAPLEPEQRAQAVVLASGGAGQPVPIKGSPKRKRLRAVACGRTAARLYGFPLIDDDDPATGARDRLSEDVSVWCHRSPLTAREPDGALRTLYRHELRWQKGDLVRRKSGLYVASAVRTLVDCASLLSFEALVCAIDDALHRKVVTPADLATAVERRAWCAGAVAFRAAVKRADGRAESPAETLARLLLLPVLPGLVPQVELFDESMRRLARFDLGDERLCFAVEADGKAGHSGTAMVAKDRSRDRRTAGRGWATERCTWWELRRQQDELVRRVVAEAQAHAQSRALPFH